MLFLPTAWACETGLPPEIGILGFWYSTVLVLHTVVWVRGTSFSLGVLYKYLRQHRWARGARVWVEVRYRAHRPGLLVRQGKRYVISTDSLGI